MLLRKILLRGKTSNYFFISGKTNKKFSRSSFQYQFKQGMTTAVGKPMGPQTLRDVVVTDFYQRDDMTATQRESFAAAMMHSVEAALKSYDRRNNSTRAEVGVSLAAELFQDAQA